MQRGRFDGHVGELLEQLDELGIADGTIVLYTTDNGAEIAKSASSTTRMRGGSTRRGDSEPLRPPC